MPRPSMRRAVHALGSNRVTVRESTGAWVGTEWVEKGDRDRRIRATIHPISPSDRRLLPEGMRTEDSITILTSSPLTVESNHEAGGRGADRVLYKGFWWKVVGLKDWWGAGFHRHVAVREARGA